MTKKIGGVCFVAGKSGGHIVPALAIAECIHAETPARKIIFFSTNAALDKKIIDEHPLIDLHIELPLGFFAHMTGHKLPLRAYCIIKSLIKSIVTLIKEKPDRVISMGGLVSIPVCCMAWLLRIPVTVYELNATPGRAVQFLARFAQEMRLCFDVARPLIKIPPKTRVIVGAYPVRFKKTDKISSEQARQRLDIDNKIHLLGTSAFASRVLLVLGGSQGSVFLNTFTESLMHYYLKTDLNASGKKQLIVLHQAGDNHIEHLRLFYQKNNIKALVCAYQKDIALWYAAADFVIARAGAGTLFELAFFNKKALIIPLETATTSHQIDNASAMVTQKPNLFMIARQETALNNNSLYAAILEQL